MLQVKERIVDEGLENADQQLKNRLKERGGGFVVVLLFKKGMIDC